MNSLLISLDKYLKTLNPGDRLNYISGNGYVTFESYDQVTHVITVRRDEETVTIRFGDLERLADEMKKGSPVHLDTFYRGGGNARTIHETFFARLPEVGWRKIDGRKHLASFPYEIHLPGELLNLATDASRRPEWALAVLVFTRIVRVKGDTWLKQADADIIAGVTIRNDKSWAARISNIMSSIEGGAFGGGENTAELSKYWMNRLLDDPKGIELLSFHAIKENADPKIVEELGSKLGIQFPLPSVTITKGEFTNKEKQEFLTRLTEANFRSSETLPPSFLQSLLAKPFVILTGNSGTGKTKIGELFAVWLSDGEERRTALVPVGADWTDSRNVLGYVNHISAMNGGNEAPLYHSTPVLDLLIEASKSGNDKKPYFLILDEMNLSHVERYFADFLSCMESNDGGMKLHRLGQNLKRTTAGDADVPEVLGLPANLFVIGTVNVDETTYMFSPKVLDRANVIEFRMPDGAAKAFLDSPGTSVKAMDPAPAGYAEGFLALAKRVRHEMHTMDLPIHAAAESNPANAKFESCKSTISALFELMRARHQEFGYRTMNEILRYLAVDYQLCKEKEKWDWAKAVDTQVLQKVLPKLHGSKRKMGAFISEIEKFCCTDGNPSKADLERSRTKLSEMIETVNRDQFVSSIQ